METEILRIADALLGVFWLWCLVISIKAGRIGGKNGFQSGQSERPGQYWFFIFILTLMVVHFVGLAISGQKPLD